MIEVFEEQGTADGSGDVQLGAESGVIAFGSQLCKQRRWITERAAMITPWQASLPCRHVGQWIAGEAPEEEAEVAKVVPAFLLGGLADVNRVTGDVERAIDALHAVEGTDIGPLALEAQMFEELRPTQQVEKFHSVRWPAGDVAGQLFEHRQGGLATAIVDGFGDIGADTRGDRGRKSLPARSLPNSVFAVSGACVRLPS
jgi:hypothetical protein